MTAGHSSPSTAWVYAVLYQDKQGKHLGSSVVEPDFVPACEGAPA